MINSTSGVASLAVLGALTFATIDTSNNSAHAADACRASPGTGTSGGQWRYRLEKGSGRKCWYLSGASSAASVGNTKSSDAPKVLSAAPKAKAPRMESSVADARAELATPEAGRLNATVWPSMQAPPAAIDKSRDPSAENPDQSMPLAQRWPEPKSVRTSDDQFAEQMRVAANTIAPEATPVSPQAMPASPGVRAASVPQDDSAINPMRILLITSVGALALVGLLLRAILSVLAKRRKRNAPRRPIWDDLAIDGERMPPYIARSAPTQPAQVTREKNQRYAYRDDEKAREEIENLLRRAAHREQH